MRLLRLRLRPGREVPDDVGLADALSAGQLGHALPRKARVGKIVPAGQIQGLERAGQIRARLGLSLDQLAQRIALRVAELDAPHADRTSWNGKHLAPERSPPYGRNVGLSRAAGAAAPTPRPLPAACQPARLRPPRRGGRESAPPPHGSPARTPPAGNSR